MHTLGLERVLFSFCKPGVLRTNNEVSFIEVQDCVVLARVTVTGSLPTAQKIDTSKSHIPCHLPTAKENCYHIPCHLLTAMLGYRNQIPFEKPWSGQPYHQVP